MSLFSIILPTCDRPALLQRALGSVLAQTCPDFELIVIDHSRDDSSAAWVASLRDPRLRLHRLDRGGGPSRSRNHGVQHSCGEWVCFLDDDDEWAPHFLETTLRTVRAEPVDFTWSVIEEISPEPGTSRIVARHSHHPVGSARQLWTTICLGIGYGVTFRRAALLQLGPFDTQVRTREDFDLFLRCVQQRLRGRFIPEVLVRIHDHPGPRVSRNVAAEIADLRYLLHKHDAYLRSQPQLRVLAHRLLVQSCYRTGEIRQARRQFLRLLRRNPLTPAWLDFLGGELPSLGRALQARLPSLLRRISSCPLCRDPQVRW